MDYSFLGSLMTVTAVATFLGIASWAYSARRKADFTEAAQLPLRDDDTSHSQGTAP